MMKTDEELGVTWLNGATGVTRIDWQWAIVFLRVNMISFSS